MRPPSRTCEVTGEQGRIAVDFVAARVVVTDVRGERVEVTSYGDFDRNDMFVEEMKHFLACVRRESSPIVSIADGARSLHVALAALESLRTGAVVTIS